MWATDLDLEAAERPQPARTSPVDALVRRARAGEEAAFRKLYARYAPTVHGVLVASVPPQEAEDLMQEVFLSAWRSLGELREPGRIGAWLASIARNRARRHAARRPARAAELPEDIADERIAGDDGEAILALVRGLPEAYRETLAMRLVEGMGGPEIAAALGRSPAAVRVNLYRGMELLRAELRRRGW